MDQKKTSEDEQLARKAFQLTMAELMKSRKNEYIQGAFLQLIMLHLMSIMFIGALHVESITNTIFLFVIIVFKISSIKDLLYYIKVLFQMDEIILTIVVSLGCGLYVAGMIYMLMATLN